MFGENGINVKSLGITEHCRQRAVERFNLKQKDHQAVLGYCRNKMKMAKFIANVTSSQGDESLLYANGQYAFYLSLDKTTIKTCIYHDKIKHTPLKQKMVELHNKEIRKLTRTENARIKRLKHTELEVNIEIAELELRKHRTRSKSVKVACDARIAALNEHLKTLHNELDTVKNEKRAIAKSLVAIM